MDIEELKRKAEAIAGQFPLKKWEGEDGDYYECPLCGGEGDVEGDVRYSKGASGIQAFGIGTDLNAMKEYVDAITPSTILSLIAEIESLRKQLEEANEARHYNANTCVKLQDEIFELKRLMHG